MPPSQFTLRDQSQGRSDFGVVGDIYGIHIFASSLVPLSFGYHKREFVVERGFHLPELSFCLF